MPTIEPDAFEPIGDIVCELLWGLLASMATDLSPAQAARLRDELAAVCPDPDQIRDAEAA